MMENNYSDNSQSGPGSGEFRPGSSMQYVHSSQNKSPDKASGGTLRRTRRVRVRTVVIPVLFLLLHLLVVNVAAMVFIIAVVLSDAARAGMTVDLTLLMDSNYLFDQISRYTSQISFVYAVILIPVYLLYIGMTRRHRPDTLWLHRPRPGFILTSCAMITGAMGLTNLYFMLLTGLSRQSDFFRRLMDDYTALTGSISVTDNILWLVLGIGLMAPIAEELLFRGIIQGELRQAMPEWVAIVIQALLFAAFHMQPVQSVYVIIPGLLLGLAYAWSRSLWVPIVMHVLFNLLGSLIPGLVQSNVQWSGVVVMIEIAFVPVGVLAGIYFYKKRRRPTRLGLASADTSQLLPEDKETNNEPTL